MTFSDSFDTMEINIEWQQLTIPIAFNYLHINCMNEYDVAILEH